MRKLTLSLTLILAVLFVTGCLGSNSDQEAAVTSDKILITSQVQDPTTTHSIWQKPSPYLTSMTESTPSPSPTPTQVPTPTPFPTPTPLPALPGELSYDLGASCKGLPAFFEKHSVENNL